MAPTRDSSELIRTDTAAPSYKVSLPGALRLVVIAGPDRGRAMPLLLRRHRFGEVTIGVGALVQVGSTSLRICGPDDASATLAPSSAERFGRP